MERQETKEIEESEEGEEVEESEEVEEVEESEEVEEVEESEEVEEVEKKNIVLFSDGTGNQGGTDSDTNVFKLYNAVKLNDEHIKQVVYYDDGVGTSKHVVWRALGGAFGLGFRRNVRDLYEFLARNYNAGDRIYVFGFSRGAATVRAFIGMVEHCGLVDKSDLKNEELFQDYVDAAMNDYSKRGRLNRWFSIGRLLRRMVFLWKRYPDYKKSVDEKVEIEFLGLWDTVAALGFPQILLLDHIVNFFRRHKFYNYQPHKCVKNIYHALAIDDERRTFWPLVWDEKKYIDQRKKASLSDGKIEQVWFPGAHSNVGGGYPRSGMANITLDWMMEKIKAHRTVAFDEEKKPKDIDEWGLVLKRMPVKKAKADANSHGKIYDSRGGGDLFYRYQPRPIKEEFEKRIKGPVRIHRSVFERMRLRTAGYAPAMIPEQFDIVNRNSNVETVDLKNKSVLSSLKIEFNKIIVKIRKTYYQAFLLSSLALFLVSGFWMANPPLEWGNYELWRQHSSWNLVLGYIADSLRFVLPDFFEGSILYGVIYHPLWFVVLVILFALLYVLSFKSKAIKNATEYPVIREWIEMYRDFRIILYWLFLFSFIALVSASLFFWIKPPLEWGNHELWRQHSSWNWVLGHIADVLRYILPDIFGGAIVYGVIQYPWWFGGLFEKEIKYTITFSF